MSEISAAADALLAYAEKQKAILTVAKALKDLGSIEQATRENEAQVVKVRAQVDKVKAELAATAHSLESLQKEQAEQIEAHEAKVKIIIASAGAEAEAIIDKAKEQARELVDDALVQTAKAEVSHQDKIRAAESRLTDIAAQAKAVEITRDGMIQESRALEAKVAAMREAASKVLA